MKNLVIAFALVCLVGGHGAEAGARLLGADWSPDTLGERALKHLNMMWDRA